MAHVKQMILQKIAVDANDASLSTQNKLVKLLANVGGAATTTAAAKQPSLSEATTKPPSRRGSKKAANSSSME